MFRIDKNSLIIIAAAVLLLILLILFISLRNLWRGDETKKNEKRKVIVYPLRDGEAVRQYCVSCGDKLYAEGKYCPYCGSRIKNR